jgi:ATP-dependent DNA ligase
MVPQVWFRPSEVWEIRFSDVTRSCVASARSAATATKS